MNKLDEIKAKYKQREELTEQLERQLHVERVYGVKAHNIDKIRLTPNKRNTLGEIEYSSVVVMKSGGKVYIPNVNIKKLLDDGVEQ